MDISKSECIEYLSRYWRKQQAVGKIAEARLGRLIRESDLDTISDIMLFPPKPEEGTNYPSIHGFILDEAQSDTVSKPVKKAAKFLEDGGVSVYIPKLIDDNLDHDASIEEMNQLEWKWRKLENGGLKDVDINTAIDAWRTNGRNNTSDEFTNELTQALSDFDKEEILPVFLREQFLYGHIKAQKTITGSAFDIDGFIYRDNSDLIPYEVKEKSVYRGNDLPQFGLDVSRLIVLLRVSQNKDVDPIYIVREVEEAENNHSFDRELVNWWFIPVSEIIRTSAWQVQGGGAGMGGAATQTLMIPKEEFKEFDPDQLDLSDL